MAHTYFGRVVSFQEMQFDGAHLQGTDQGFDAVDYHTRFACFGLRRLYDVQDGEVVDVLPDKQLAGDSARSRLVRPLVVSVIHSGWVISPLVAAAISSFA